MASTKVVHWWAYVKVEWSVDHTPGDRPTGVEVVTGFVEGSLTEEHLTLVDYPGPPDVVPWGKRLRRRQWCPTENVAIEALKNRTKVQRDEAMETVASCDMVLSKIRHRVPA
jgi:hypothetical protein